MKVNILGISELRWTGMGEFNSDDHFIYYCGQESLRRNIISIIVKKKKKSLEKRRWWSSMWTWSTSLHGYIRITPSDTEVHAEHRLRVDRRT